jgi:hypothetical protein
MYMHNVRILTLTNSPIYADVIAPTRPAILDTPITDALRTVGNSSAGLIYIFIISRMHLQL